MKDIRRNVELKEMTTLRLPCKAGYFKIVQSKKDLVKACEWASKNGVEIFVLGGGSNIVLKSKTLNTLVLKMEIIRFDVLTKDEEGVCIKIGGGENWDKVVERVVEMGLSGIECLSLIPGTAGATPVQNVGAYGQEIGDVLVELEAYDTKDKKFVVMKHEECDFTYRDSIFKKDKRFIIVSITLKLSKSKPQISGYPALIKYFEEKKINNPTLKQIRNAIIEIRNSKLPDPEKIPNVGSFFGNPIISKKTHQALLEKYPDIPSNEVEGGKVKLYAGWLIEKAGFKGMEYKNVGVYDKQALIIINKGGGDFSQINELKNMIVSKVKDMFGVELIPEPEFV